MKNRQSGLTLVEVLISTAVLTVVLLGVYLIWGQSQRSFQVAQARANLQADARAGMATLIREFRQASYVSLTDAWSVANDGTGRTRSSISFAFPTETGVQGVRYALDDECGGQGTGVCLVRQPLTATLASVDIGGVSYRFFTFAATGQQQVLASSVQPGTGFEVFISSPGDPAVALPLGQADTQWIGSPVEAEFTITMRDPARAGSPQARDLSLNSTSIARNHR